MNIRWGGKGDAKRDTVIEEGCLGPDPPVLNVRKLTIGSVQRMIFEEGLPPPFQDPTVPPHDREMTVEEKIVALEKIRKNKVQKQKRSGQTTTEDIEDTQPTLLLLDMWARTKAYSRYCTKEVSTKKR